MSERSYTVTEEMVEAGARGAAEAAGFCWENCAQDQWRRDMRAAFAAALPLAPAQPASASGCTAPEGAFLWCCHARGPDDVYAAPDYATALAWSDTLNALNWDTKDPRYPKPRGFTNPALYDDLLIKAVPAPWPHSPEAHAEDLPRSIEGFALPSTMRRAACQCCGETKDLKCGPSRFGAETWACADCWEPDGAISRPHRAITPSPKGE